jgi:hypothetical protein
LAVLSRKSKGRQGDDEGKKEFFHDEIIYSALIVKMLGQKWGE